MTEIHNPPSLDLPPLKIAKGSDRQAFEANREINALISSNLLLDEAFSAVYMGLFAKTKELRQLIELATVAGYSPWPQIVGCEPQGQQLSDFLPSPTTVTYTYKLSSTEGEVFSRLFQKAQEEQAAIARQGVGQKIIKLSDEMQNALSQYEQSVGRHFPILSTETLYVCKECNRVVSVDWFQAVSCKCRKAITTTSDVFQLSVKCFSKILSQFLAANLWLEYGIAHLFRQKNANTLVGRHVLGHSGVWHEIDVIAESKQHNQRIVSECKNAELKASDAFVLSGKMNDIGCAHGYLFSTAPAVHQDIHRIGKSKNIRIVYEVMKKKREQLLDELREL